MLINKITLHNKFRSFRIEFFEQDDGALMMKLADMNSHEVFTVRKIAWQQLKEGKPANPCNIVPNAEPEIGEPPKTTDMSFGEAIELMRIDSDLQLSREGWNGADQYISLQRPDEHSANSLPYLWIRTVQGDRVPWLASQTDMLAEDWFLV